MVTWTATVVGAAPVTVEVTSTVCVLTTPETLDVVNVEELVGDTATGTTLALPGTKLVALLLDPPREVLVLRVLSAETDVVLTETPEEIALMAATVRPPAGTLGPAIN
jgi:hypothetical protein